jgi:hypothetical protein
MPPPDIDPEPKYVIVTPSELGNYKIADTRPVPGGDEDPSGGSRPLCELSERHEGD